MGGRGALAGAGVLLAATLTIGTATRLAQADPPVTGNPGGVVAVTAGDAVTCAVVAVASGVATAKCWGLNADGQLGRDNRSPRGEGTNPMETLGAITLAFGEGDGPAEIALGAGHACARSQAGDVICWGDNANGQLGIGSTSKRGDSAGEMAALVPVTIGAPGRSATRVVAGNAHTCILSVSKDVTCWGFNGDGQLGVTSDGSDEQESLGDAPGEMAGLQHVSGGAPVASLASGARHVCALTEAGAILCWGDNQYGQLGRATPAVAGAVPLALDEGEVVNEVSAGDAHTCALTSEGRVLCWGRNNRGQLGLGDTSARGDAAGEIAALEAVPLPGAATSVSAGGEHTCALLEDTTVRCWGNGGLGRLGYGNENNLGDEVGEISVVAAVPMATSRFATTISSGVSHTCIRRDNGTVICWGSNSWGQLGQDDVQTRGDTAGEVVALPPIVLTPPALTVDAVATTSTTANAVFDLAGDEPIDCATVSDTPGTDIEVTSAASVAVTQHAPDTCRITVVSTVADGATGQVTLSAATGFAAADSTGQVTRVLGLGDVTVTIDRVAPVVPTSTTTSTTSTTTTATTTTTISVPTTPAPLTLRIGRAMRITRVLNRAAVSAPSLARVWFSVRPASTRRCSLRAGKVVARRAGACRLVITVVGRGGSLARHNAMLRIVRR